MDQESTYIPRIADKELSELLESVGAVVIEGPRACGKTLTARQHAASEVLLDVDDNARRLIALDPAVVLEGAVPRLIDEWQLEPTLWNHIRREVDERRQPGQFILTGSAVPADDITRHSGAGRLSRIHMRPLSLFESGVSDGGISLGALLDGDSLKASERKWPLKGVLESISIGGWPGMQHLDPDKAIRAVRSYLGEVRRVDISRLGGRSHDSSLVAKTLRSLARNVTTTASLATLAADAGGAEGPIDPETVAEYLETLERIMIVEDQPAWAPSLRSRSRLRKAAKRHFVDPSLAVAAIGASPERLIKDLEFVGYLFESLVIRDLRVYSGSNNASVFHYQDNTDLEIDAVVERNDGRWAAFEVKLGTSRVDEAAQNLLTFRDRVATDEPGFLGVIVSSGYNHVREDGVAVICASSLGP